MLNLSLVNYGKEVGGGEQDGDMKDMPPHMVLVSTPEIRQVRWQWMGGGRGVVGMLSCPHALMLSCSHTPMLGPFVQAQKEEKEEQELKGSMRQRMGEFLDLD